MNWQIVILLQTVLAGAGIVSLRILARDTATRHGSFAIVAGMYVVLYAVMLPFVPWLGQVHTSVLEQYWWRFVGGGLAFTLTNVCTYKTLVYFDAAVASIAGTMNVLFTIVGAGLLLGEDLSLLQLCGAIVLLVAISYGVLATHKAAKKLVRRSILLGVTFALLAGLSYAVAQVNEKSLLQQMPMATYVVFGVGGQCLMTVLAALAVQRKQLALLLRPHIAGWTLTSGVLRGLAGVSFIFAEVKSNNVALVTVVSNFRLIVVVFLAAWLLKERERLQQKLTAAVAALAGLTIMFWK